ncbi:CPBP family intramembrane metalloprotease [Turicibacter sanguinis]|uniref:CPBP family intramembrane glutamic endopeptidase n=1 Tax=Turicibacter TaxID=191303 RepID=UPI0001FD7FDA|nr:MULTISPECIES: type II CAAX endopeptidase family protein [Turicibacter]EGC92938.1 CAAX amino terminal protease family protein [Turicibacter sp. HGF1]MCU7197946.1 CPBP family intramembrane metalloprotease [Turicibacter sanguinis]MDB8544879.1 type II CAAX endopeptidase family protein [Turicibacter sanguinis]MDB8567372.1 type II CAAX endopeptidase family protein [Turicibacter sanguinis]MDB8570122.1 type II CAAX endopeptidase family protein [Turicibacter sanguinis]
MENYSYIETRKVFSRLGFALTFSILSVNVVQLIVAGFMSAVDPNLLMTDWANFFLIAVSFYLIGFPLAYCMMKKIPVAVSQEKKRLTLWQLVEYGLISYAVMILLNFLTTFLLSFIELFKTESIVNPVQQVILTGSPWLSLLCIVVLSPIIEELLFRKILLDRVRIYGDKVAIIFTAIAFGFYHGNLSQLFYAVGLGIILAYIVLKTNQLKYSIGIHMFVNAMGSLILPMLIGDGSDLLRAQIASVIVVILITFGTILIIKNRKKVELVQGDLTIPESKLMQLVWLNHGVFAYLLFSIALIIMVTVVT